MQRGAYSTFVRVVPFTLTVAVCVATAACATSGPNRFKTQAGASGGPKAGAGGVSGSGTAGAGASAIEDPTISERPLTLDLTLAVDTDAGVDDPATLTITARDGTTPLLTDLWLYTLDDDGTQTPLSEFTATAMRKSPHRMLPATIAGAPTGYEPADDGNANGLMTHSARGRLERGAFISSVTGTVVVSLSAPPTKPILVIAAVEDQRYAGAAAIAPDGTAASVPDGVGVPQTHVRRSFTRDVTPILVGQCVVCHGAFGPPIAALYLVGGSRDALVNDNYGLVLGTLRCNAENPAGGPALAACIRALDEAKFLVEPGAPALSPLLQRSRPDENAGTSPMGLLWYGNKGQRFDPLYGDLRMPSTSLSTDMSEWYDGPTSFDMNPADFQVLFDWVAQGALP